MPCALGRAACACPMAAITTWRAPLMKHALRWMHSRTLNLIAPFSLPLVLHLGPPLSRPTTTTRLAEPRGDGLSHTHATFQSTRTTAAPLTYNRARGAAGARIELHVRHMQRRAHGAEERRSGWGGAASKPKLGHAHSQTPVTSMCFDLHTPPPGPPNRTLFSAPRVPPWPTAFPAHDDHATCRASGVWSLTHGHNFFKAAAPPRPAAAATTHVDYCGIFCCAPVRGSHLHEPDGAPAGMG